VTRRFTTLLWGAASLVTACSPDVPPREAEIVNTIVRADLPLLRSRPALVAGKYRQMAAGAYAFFRGTFPLYLHDAGNSSLTVGASDYGVDGALPLGIGDAHPENFGILIAPDESFAIEPNDFDGADRYPFLWELRRLCVGITVAGRLSNEDDGEQRLAVLAAEHQTAAAVARGYAQAMAALARGAAPLRVTDDGGSAIAADLFERALGDHQDREELDELTELVDGVRTLRRGGIDSDLAENVYLDLPAFAYEALPDVIARYRDTLIEPPAPDHFTLLDAARELGSGVASWPRVRIILLLHGPSDAPDDDLILELKELGDSGAGGWAPPGVSFDSVGERVVGSARLLWARPDAEPLWGHATMLGLPVQLKREAEGLKTVRVARFVGMHGTPQEIAALGGLLGSLLARMHAASGDPLRKAIADAISADVDGFAAEQADAALGYADQVGEDWLHFQRALDRLGPTLGVRPDAADRPSPELRALFGTPPEVAP
jgi:uncharacterized protein (DUF2252 family)